MFQSSHKRKQGKFGAFCVAFAGSSFGALWYITTSTAWHIHKFYNVRAVTNVAFLALLGDVSHPLRFPRDADVTEGMYLGNIRRLVWERFPHALLVCLCTIPIHFHFLHALSPFTTEVHK